MFRLTPWVEPQTFIGSSVDGVPTEQDSVQVWFAGVHADVGGGYPEHQSGLSKYPLIWMVEEAVKSGLTINPATFQELAWGISVRANTSATNVLPNFSAPMHNSLFGFWRLLEFLPKSARYKEWPGRRSFLGFYIPAGEPRLIPEGAIIHEFGNQKDGGDRGLSSSQSAASVPDRIDARENGYGRIYCEKLVSGMPILTIDSKISSPDTTRRSHDLL